MRQVGLVIVIVLANLFILPRIVYLAMLPILVGLDILVILVSLPSLVGLVDILYPAGYGSILSIVRAIGTGRSILQGGKHGGDTHFRYLSGV